MQTPRTRRPRLSYANVTATLALVIATSMGGAYAHGKIGPSQIKNNAVKSRHIGFAQVKTPDLGRGAVNTVKLKSGAVKTPKLANNAVTVGKLAPSARSKTYMYTTGGHNFGTDSTAFINVPVSGAAGAQSTWTAALRLSDTWYQIPGGVAAGSQYRLFFDEGDQQVRIWHSAGTANNVAEIRVFRTEKDITGGTSLPITRAPARSADAANN